MLYDLQDGHACARPWMAARAGALIGAAAGLAAMLSAGSAHAVTLGGESMTSWAGCENNQNALTYTDDQISLWLSKMQSLGHTRKFWYANSSVWASDFVEDDWGGQDNLYNDSVDFFALSSHGGAGQSGGSQYWETPACRAGTYTSSSFRSWDSTWDESLPNPLASPAVGWARFLMLLTCFSVDTNPNQQWGWPTSYGNDVIMGYRGLSADAATTAEVGEDLGAAAFNDGDTFKAAWFWAVEDWSVDDTGAILFGGVDAAQCDYRRNNLRASWARRTGAQFFQFCWSWHEG
jgi:hypothetical protein